MQMSAYRLRDEQASREALSNQDFFNAVSGAMAILGPCLLYHPNWGDPQSGLQIGALRDMDLHDWPFWSQEGRHQAALLMEEGAVEDAECLERAFGYLLRGPHRLPAAPWGSVYMDREKVTYGGTWVELRQWMRDNGIVTLYQEKDPEDHIGRMMILAGQLAKERPELLCEYLGKYLLTWSGRFFQLFVPAALDVSPTYGAVAVLARDTLEDIQDVLGVIPARYRMYR